MVSTLAQILDIGFKRIQFTPDLMPSDITGTNVLEEDERGKRAFRFVEGPIFTNILLADEINRTPPKTQAALLQAMQEREVTVGRQTYELPEPFFTIATQNPIEQEGTYPLPEAQLDRFMFNIKVDYPDGRRGREDPVGRQPQREGRSPQGALGPGDREPAEAGQLGGGERVHRQVRLARWCAPRGREDATAPEFVRELVDWGAGPRAGQFLINGGKALAAMDGRFSVAVDDVQRIAIPVLRHRISTNFQAQAEGMTTEDVIHAAVERDPRTGNSEVRRTAETATVARDLDRARLRTYGAAMSSVEKYLKPEVINQIKRLDLRASSSSRDSCRACTPARFTGSRSSSASTASTRPATIRRTSTGWSSPRPTSTTSRSSRPRPTSPATW